MMQFLAVIQKNRLLAVAILRCRDAARSRLPAVPMYSAIPRFTALTISVLLEGCDVELPEDRIPVKCLAFRFASTEIERAIE